MNRFAAGHSEVQAVLAWAKATVAGCGLDGSLMSTPRSTFSESDFLRELAWVILCSGFRERVVRRLFWKVSLCFLDWVSAEEITKHSSICVTTALDVFGSKPKINAIARAAELIAGAGFEIVRRNVLESPIQALQKFPFVGKITACHLAKNLGFDACKPDRHLQRLSHRHGYSNVHEFCAALGEASGESVRNIDTLLWRMSEMGLGAQLVFPSIASRRNGNCQSE
jgi:endonuclease III